MANFFDQFDAPSIDPRARNLAIRTVLGEAADEPDDGQAAVAAVIKNRLDSGRYGKSLPEVMLARNQFEPWSTPQGRARMMSYAEDSPQYIRAAGSVDRAFGGFDPTNGATHFYSPTAQSALGRQPPNWASGEPTVIGRHNFYAPEGRVRVAQTSENFFDQFDAPLTPPTARITVNPVAERFAEPEKPANAPQLEAGLQRQARDTTTGPKTTPAQNMAISHGNILSGASQGATPNVDILSKNLISAEVFEGDDGSIQYKDPQTGQIVPTDNTKHIVMRDPADNTPKVYARTEEATENPAVGIARTLAPGAMAGAPTARAAIPAMKNVDVRASDIMATAKPSYRAFEQQARATPAPEGIADRIRGALDAIGLNEEMAGAPVRAALTYLDSGKIASLNDLQKVKRIIGHGFNNTEKTVRDAAGVASRELVAAITDVAPTAAQNLKKGDAIHSTAMAVQDLQRKTDVAQLRKGRAGYGGNAVNSMRQVLSPIVQRAIEGKKTPFKPDEIAAIREIVEGTNTTNTLRQIGAYSPSKGAINSGVGAYAGSAIAGPIGYAVPAIGAASNKLAAILTGKQIDRLKELVAKRSPEYAKAVERAVQRYERAQLEMINNPSPNRLAGYISASRALSSGLTRDGIQVTSGDLLKLIQGPVKSAAEGEEPSVPRSPRE